MGYEAVEQHDYDSSQDEDDATRPLPLERRPGPISSCSQGLFLDHHNTRRPGNSPLRNKSTRNLNSASQSSKTRYSYEMLEDDDFENGRSISPIAEKPAAFLSPSEDPTVPLRIPNPRRRPKPATDAESPIQLPSFPSEPLPRTTSGCSIGLRHPTPDLQVLQGAYAGNIQHLEKTAERLSMTSSIEDAIKELHDEQKRSDSRRSSLMSAQGMGAISRQVSNASSIVEVNSTARSGGYSPAGFLLSPKSSFTNINTRGRSSSKSSKLSRPEPDMEGRPLDSFPIHSPTFSRTDSIAEQDEPSSTLTRPIVNQLDSVSMEEVPKPSQEEEDRPVTAATEEPEDAFADFDGIHTEPLQPRSASTIPGASELVDSDLGQRRASSGARLSMLAPRPQSYADPNTGQEMVYYPAPVPMMLNLPQKLSKNPSSMARNKRRSQVLSGIPAAARQSAIWLPDVLETEDEVAENEDAQAQEYMAQHQRASMGGRRLTQDLSHMPPQLRASTYFDLPGPTQVVELRDNSAVATLDSILDASAHAPVSAFTDHAFAGTLGAEVYGRSHSRNTSQISEKQPKKRSGSFNLLRGRRNSSGNDLEDAEKDINQSMLTSVVQSAIRSPIEDDDEDELKNKDTTPLQRSEAGNPRVVSGDFAVKQPEEDEGSDDGQLDDEIYHGPPTTLLAELQLRKQRQKQRTQPLTKTYPNGIHSTLLQMDTVIQTEQKARKKGRTILAWEDPSAVQAEADAADDDDDVPLAMLFSKKAEENRPLGLMERRELEDNEPLSRRRERLHGKPAMPRASTMMNLSSPTPCGGDEENETLAQRVKRLKETTIPATRPVSGDFANEMISQFGGDFLFDPQDKGKGKETEVTPSPGLEEEETLGQRRKRLQAEREARAKEVGNGVRQQTQRLEPAKRRSMADILQVHPSAGADRAPSYEKPIGGLLSMHEKHAKKASTMLNYDTAAIPNFTQHIPKKSSGAFKAGLYNDGQGGIVPAAPAPRQMYHQNQYAGVGGGMFPQPSLGIGNAWANPYPMMNMNMNAGYDPNQFQMQLGYMQQQMNMMAPQPLNQGQIDMVERWRQSVLQ